MTMIYDPIPFVKLVQKFLVGNYEPIMGICGKYLKCNLRKCCSCCELKINFPHWCRSFPLLPVQMRYGFLGGL